MNTDISKTSDSKRRTRRELQALPFEEKLLILERLREDLLVGLASQRKNSAKDNHKSESNEKSILLQSIAETLDQKPRERGKHKSVEDENALNFEIDAVLADRQQAIAAFKALFPDRSDATPEFFPRLNNLHMRLGWREPSTRLVGALLSVAISQLTEKEGEALLAELPLVASPGFFQALDYIGVVLRERELRPLFAAEWFPTLAKRIGNDLASGSFWKALEGYCEQHPLNALEVLRCLLIAHDEEQIAVAANILGLLRSIELPAEAFTATESEFSGSPTLQLRAVYYRSWIQTAWRGKMHLIHLQDLTTRMSAGSVEEREQVFWIVCRSLLSQSITSDVFGFGMQWLRTNAVSALPPIAKYHIVDFAAQLQPNRCKEAAELILAVQPLLPEHKGIWQRIEHFLVALLERDLNGFAAFFIRLGRSNPVNWMKVLKTGREFEWLLSEMRTKDVSLAVGRLVLDETVECRKLGLFFFDDLDLGTLPKELFDEIGERRIALAFYELQRAPIHAPAIARSLILLIPGMERVGNALQQQFYNELLLQLKNYPGGCREEFERRATEFPILKKAISETDIYFEQLKKIRESGIVGMEVPGARQAARLYYRRFNRAVSKGAEEMSVFMQMCKKVRLLYGKQWSTFQSGTLSESSGLDLVSSSMEIPRMEYIDPEGMNLRRYHASMRIRELSHATNR